MDAYMPATVEEHTKRHDGVVLHTIGDDHETDIKIYADDRSPHRLGNPPESNEE